MVQASDAFENPLTVGSGDLSQIRIDILQRAKIRTMPPVAVQCKLRKLDDGMVSGTMLPMPYGKGYVFGVMLPAHTIPGELLCSKCASRTFGTALPPLDDGAQPQAQRFCDLVLAKGSQSKSRVFNATLTQRTACPTCVEAYAFIAVLSCILSSGQMPRAEPLTPEPSARCGRPGN
jgi:hypothetical protein